MTAKQKQQLLIQILAALIPVLFITIASIFAWYTFVNARLAVIDNSIKQLEKVISDQNSELRAVNLGGLVVRVKTNTERIEKLEREN